jgi:WD40 repeat protein
VVFERLGVHSYSGSIRVRNIQSIVIASLESITVIFRWPVRTLSFSHDGNYLASGSEDLFIDIVSQ